MSRHQVSIRPRPRSPLDLIFLGGCGEIGMNLTLYGFENDWIAVDCGMSIRQQLPGSPIQIPDAEALAREGIRPSALVITHGHEDHIGAIVWLWPRWGCPIWASPLVAAMLHHRFAQHGLDTRQINVFQPDEAFEQGPFGIRTLPVTHSIPESCALLITVGKHRILHTGDWKIDPAPLIGEAFNEPRFRSLGKIDLLLGDSTNAPVPGHSDSEASVLEHLLEAVEQCPNRVVISCFASNVARIKAAGIVAKKTGRRLILAGRAMERMVHIAKSCGYLKDLPPVVPLRDAGYLPREEVLLIATGSQGEPGAALSRIANSRMHDMELEAGDTVIFSSRVIPGNEAPIAGLVRAFRQRNITVMDEHDHPELHTSGHPAQEELKALYHWVRPGYLVPVHGTPEHQTAHLGLAHTLGIAGELLPKDGDWLKWNGEALLAHKTLTLTPRLIDQQREPRKANRPGLRLVIPVVGDAEGWTRVSRLIIDPPPGIAIDETSFADWLDETLPTLQADSIKALHAPLLNEIKRQLQAQGIRGSQLYLDLVDMSA